MKKVRTLKPYKKGDIVSPDKGRDAKKKYEVVDIRKFIPFLGEPKGYLVTLKELK